MNLYEAISKRISVRTYEKKSIDQFDIKTIKNILSKYESIKGPFGHSFEFNYSQNNSDDTNGKKIGTYGLLKNVPAYIGGVCQNFKDAIIDYGYVFEHIILELTALGFGTCWLGGTFKRDDYKKDLKVNQIIPAISPVGYPSINRSIAEKMLRRAANSDHRLPFEQLFFDMCLNPLSEDFNDYITDSLLLIRKGPSASNKQPWRIIVDKDNLIYHLYLERTPNYAKMLNYDIQALDIGIAIAHFEISLKKHMISYKKEILENHPKNEHFEYIISFQSDK
ncbi:MAG: hypothetical protein K8Q99_01225 [Acholeplasmataceae bacterium]|nr:hypothetical protein [Acholeplasmataceae bacterium]